VNDLNLIHTPSHKEQVKEWDMHLAQTFDHQLGLPSMPNVTPIIFVIDEDIYVRESLAASISSEGWQAETFASAREFLAWPRPLVPSCLLLSLPHVDGVDVQKQIARERAEMPIIVTSSHEDIATTVQVMKAGAIDFLVKPFSPDVLLSAVSQALECSRVALDREMEARDLRNCYASLSRRERQVMALVTSGLLNKQAGAELGISEITVKAHRGQVMRKMKANSFPDLVRKAAELWPAREPVYLA
jgi:FixJ family two-component response regulator